MTAVRLHAAAVASGRTKDRVPALAVLQQLAAEAEKVTPEQAKALIAARQTLTYLFDLDRFASELLLLGVALELDERIYHAALSLTATLPGSPGPRVGGWLSLLYPSLVDRANALQALMEEGPLLRYRLVRVLGEANTPLSQREFCGEPALIGQLIAGAVGGLPTPLVGLGDLIEPPAHPREVAAELPEDLSQLLSLLALDEVPVRALHVHPLVRRNALALARRIAAKENRPVIMLDLRTVEKDVEIPVAVTLREARLRHGIPMFLNPMTSTADDEPNERTLERLAQRWRRMLATEKNLVLFGTDSREANDLARLERIGLSVAEYKLRVTTMQERAALFDHALAAQAAPSGGGITEVEIAEDVSVDDLAAIYRVDEGEIQAIVRQAALGSQTRALAENERPLITASDLWQAGRDITKREIGKYATLIRSAYTWDDLVLDHDTQEDLLDFFHGARSRIRVYEEWGFGRKHLRRRGMCSLFSGDSGTGKTMAAEVIANMLNVNMYKVDLSMVVSKWLGETERNLGEIFAATESTDNILFFDEADALFGKRTEVSDARDRYANVETSYLLQRIEDYDGIVILSTNFRTNIDKAFFRRIQYGIHFEKPDLRSRTIIWSKVFPPETPLASDIDFGELASRYEELTGGEIRVVSIGACLLACAIGSEVTYEHIQRAYTHEMYKLQKLVMNESGQGGRLQVAPSRGRQPPS